MRIIPYVERHERVGNYPDAQYLVNRRRFRMSDRAYDRERLKALLHYVIWVAGARPGFGAVKLYKVAWFSDARRFVLAGNSITGAAYVREKYGPMPRDAWSVREELASIGAIRQWKDRVYDHEAWRFKALTPPNVNFFSGDEKKEVDYWIRHIDEDHTAETISDLSHGYGWEIASTGERLPFHSVLAQRIRDPNEEELQWAREAARQIRLI